MAQGSSSKKTNKKIFFLVLVLIAFLSALIAVEYSKTVIDGKYTASEKPIKEFPFDAGSKADFAVWENKIYYYTKDGIQLLNSEGDTLWSETYNMSLPYMVQKGGIAGVCEQKGRVVIIYDEDGKKYSVQTNNPVIGFSVNSTGYSSIISSSENEYQLEVHNSNGDIIFSGHFQISQGIPVTSAISDDGSILAIGFLNITEISISSRVSFYEINSNAYKSSETENPVFASFTEENAAFGAIRFLDNSSLAAVSDKSITFVELKPNETEKYKEKSKIQFKNQIKQIAFDQNSNIYISFGDKLINSETDALENGTVIGYNKNGGELFRIQTKRKVTGIYPKNRNILIGMDRYFHCYDLSGNFLWEYNTKQDTKKILLIDESSLVLFVGSNQAAIYRLTNEVLNDKQSDFIKEETTESKSSSQKEHTPVITTREPETEPVTSAVNSVKNSDSNKNNNSGNRDTNDNDNQNNKPKSNNNNNSSISNNKASSNTVPENKPETEVKTETNTQAVQNQPDNTSEISPDDIVAPDEQTPNNTPTPDVNANPQTPEEPINSAPPENNNSSAE